VFHGIAGLNCELWETTGIRTVRARQEEDQEPWFVVRRQEEDQKLCLVEQLDSVKELCWTGLYCEVKRDTWTQVK
jgi:hypothetical protein